MSKDSYEIGTLEITGAHGLSIQNQYIQQIDPVDNLAVVFPGLRYNCDKPLLYYTTQILIQHRYDVLQLRADYKSREFKNLSKAEQTIQLIEDGKSLLNSGLQARSYSNILIAGKSLGTIIMAFILNENHELLSARTIWLTPLMHFPTVSQAIVETTGPAFVVGSNTDTTFGIEPVSRLQSMTNVVVHTVQDANHSLEIPGDPLRSLQTLIQVAENLNKFLR